jgi:PAS domain S-box-containing protein
MAHEAAHTVEGRAGQGTSAVASVKAGLAAAVADAVRRRSLTQTEAARRCGTDQPTLSKVLRSGRLDLVSVDKLLSWLAALGVDIELLLTPGGDRGEVRLHHLATTGVDHSAEENGAGEPEGWFRLLAEAMPGFVFVADASGRNLYTNLRYQQYTGLSAEELQDEGWQLAVHPDDREPTAAAWQAAVAHGALYEGEYRLRGCDGAYRWFLCRGLPAPGRDGHASRWFGVGVDIDDRRTAEEALRRSEERFRAVVDDQTELISRFTPDLVITFVNRAYAERLGRRAEDLVGASVLAPMGETQRAAFRARIAQLTPEAPTVAYETAMVLRDGQPGWEQWTDRALFDRAGRLLGYQSVGRDVTERKLMEQALREREGRYRATQEHAGVGIAEVDAKGRFLRVNPAICAITGYSREELPGRTVFDITQPDDAREERVEYARLVAGEIDTYAREKRYRRPDGSERWVEIAATAVRDPDGRFLYGVRVVQDVNDRKLAQDRQRLLLAELSHRVKNTLAVVQGIAARSLSGDRTPDEARDALSKRLRALARAHDLLTASAWRGAGLRAVVEGELRPYRERVKLHGPDLTLAPKAAQTLGLVLHELATNAAKHGALSSPDGRVELAWSLASVAGSDRLRLVWRESSGPAVVVPTRRGFGRTLIEQGWRHDLGGEVDLAFLPQGVECALTVPADVVLATSRSIGRSE